MTHAFNDRYKINLMLTVLFIIGIGASLFAIYSLPAKLRLGYGYQPEFLPVYIIIGFTFLLGSITLVWALRYKKEVLVFKDRIIDAAQAEREAAEQAGKTTISLESVKSSLQFAQSEKEILQSALQAVCQQLEAGQGAVYKTSEENEKRIIELKTGYALSMGESAIIRFEFGEGLIGQVALSGKTLFVDEVPKGYINIISGLGSSSPKYLLIIPIKKNDNVLGVMEIASFTTLTEDQRKFAEESAQLIAEKISTTAKS